MEGIWKKMNFKPVAATMVLNAPEEFLPSLDAIKTLTNVCTHLEEAEKVQFCMVFATRLEEVNYFAEALAPKLEGDGALWFCYPKGTSKKYKCDFNRDNGWAALGKLGFEPVRQIAIDENWSALRFRKVEFIKTITRGFAMTEEGKNRTTKEVK